MFPTSKFGLLVRSIQRLVLPKLQRLLALTRIALLGIMAHGILALRRLLGRAHASVLRVADGIRNAACVLVLGASCRGRGVDILRFGG